MTWVDIKRLASRKSARAAQRPSLKLIVTSATMEAEKYSEYFNKKSNQKKDRNKRL